MNWIKIGLFVVLLDFVAFTAWVVATGGTPGEIVAAFSASPWTLQVAVDLVLALSLVCVWMWNDAKSRGANPVPWVAATVLTGSIAPLAYLLLRPRGAAAPDAGSRLLTLERERTVPADS
ncbi:MAG: DUF2834 domain-containing protein [Myxococcota bacterium]